MEKRAIVIIIGLIMVLFWAWFECSQFPNHMEISKQKGYTVHMQIESPAFQNKGRIPKHYTCDGESVNPPLAFKDIPSGAESLALILEDPDVPHSIRADGIFDHWVIWNLSPQTEMIEEGISPVGMYGSNTSGTKKYIGLCPPDGEHRYFFKLFALDAKLSLTEGSSKSELLAAMEGHIISEAEIFGTYNRSK